MSNRTPVAAYIRCSTDKQSETSPDRQCQEIEVYAKSKGYAIVETFEDVGISGDKTEDRIEFLRMVASAGAEWRRILVFDRSRYGRFDSLEAGHWAHQLRQKDTVVESVTEGELDWNSFAGRIVDAVNGEAKHQFLGDLARSVRSGLRRNAAKGIWQSGKPPFGYTLDADKRLLADPDQSEIVATLFSRYVGGESLRDLGDYLTGRGVDSPRGGKWSIQGISNLLKNRVYLGEYEFGKKNRSRHLPAGEFTIIPHNHPAIVTSEMFDAVAARLKIAKSGTTPGRSAKRAFALTGRVKCAHCGSTMTNRTEHKGKRVLVCGGYLSGGSCPRRAVPESETLKLILAKIDAAIWPDHGEPSKLRERIEAAVIDEVNADLKGNRKGLAEKSVAKLEGKIKSLETRYVEAPSDMASIIAEAIRSARAELQVARSNLKASQRSVEDEKWEWFDRVTGAHSRLKRIGELAADPDADARRVNAMLGEFNVTASLRIEGTPISKGSKSNRWAIVAGEIAFSIPGATPALLDLIRTTEADRATRPLDDSFGFDDVETCPERISAVDKSTDLICIRFSVGHAA